MLMWHVETATKVPHYQSSSRGMPYHFRKNSKFQVNLYFLYFQPKKYSISNLYFDSSLFYTHCHLISFLHPWLVMWCFHDSFYMPYKCFLATKIEIAKYFELYVTEIRSDNEMRLNCHFGHYLKRFLHFGKKTLWPNALLNLIWF